MDLYGVLNPALSSQADALRAQYMEMKLKIRMHQDTGTGSGQGSWLTSKGLASHECIFLYSRK